MPSAAGKTRSTADSCPGVLRLAAAADGYLARVRVPGGVLDSAGLYALAKAARELGDLRLELTSRGNVQLRGLDAADADELGARLAEAGLWPSVTHELVRNIVASPLADLVDEVRELDAAICADDRLAELSGRFLFGLDDGTGDISALGPDVLGIVPPGSAAPDALIAGLVRTAHAFLDERAEQGSNAWRVNELADGAARIRARLGLEGEPAPAPAPPPAPAGVVAGKQVLLVPLGRLTADQADWVAARLEAAPARVTPWRSLVLPGLLTSDSLAEAGVLGFGLDAGSRWYGVSSCAGQPGCAKALADVQAEAARTAGQWPAVHFSGCERRCGRPVDTQVDVVATEDGYVIWNV